MVKFLLLIVQLKIVEPVEVSIQGIGSTYNDGGIYIVMNTELSNVIIKRNRTRIRGANNFKKK